MVPYRQIFERLANKNVKYLIAGGFAVNFHQVQRATVDLDLILMLEKANILAFVSIMKELGFTPRIPVEAEDLADETKRQSWIDEKNMMVFSFLNSGNPFEVVDIFIKEPKPFEELWPRRFSVTAFNLSLNVVSKEDLIDMKMKAGRDKDLYDIQQLKKTS